MRLMVPKCQLDHVPPWSKALQWLPITYWMKSQFLIPGPPQVSAPPYHPQNHHAVYHMPCLCLSCFYPSELEVILQNQAQVSFLLRNLPCLISLAAKHSLLCTPCAPKPKGTILAEHWLPEAKVDIIFYHCFNT